MEMVEMKMVDLSQVTKMVTWVAMRTQEPV